MKSKNLIILALLAAALGGWAYWTSRRSEQAVHSLIGTRVLADFPINDICKIIVTSPDSTIEVARMEDKWVVPSKYNYPANFEKIADTMRQLNDMKAGQVISMPDEQLGELNLLIPGEADDEERHLAGTLVELFDDREQLLDFIVIGKSFLRRPAQTGDSHMMHFGAHPVGQYIRRSDGMVFLVSERLERLKEDAKTWLDDELIDVSAADIREISVTGPGRAAILLKRDENNELSLEGIDPEKEKTNRSKANRMAGALRHMSLYDIASPDLAPEQTGFDEPIVFTARTKLNLVYTIKLGRESEDTATRYMRVRIDYQHPDTDAESQDMADMEESETSEEDAAASARQAAKDAEALNARFGGWTYMIRSFRADPFLLEREEIIEIVEEEEEEEEEEET